MADRSSLCQVLTNPAVTFSGRRVFLLSSVSVFFPPEKSKWLLFFLTASCFLTLFLRWCNSRPPPPPPLRGSWQPGSAFCRGFQGAQESVSPRIRQVRYRTEDAGSFPRRGRVPSALLPPVRSSVISPPVCHRFPSAAVLAASLPPGLTRDGGRALYYYLVFSAADGLVTGIIKSAH